MEPITDQEVDKKLESLAAIIKAWIKTESGPSMTIWRKDLALKVTFKGWKKIILERDFKRAEAEANGN